MKIDSEKEAGTIILRSYGHLFKKQYQDFVLLSHDDDIWNNNKTFLPIKTYTVPQELVSITDLVTSDNTLMTKVLSVITSLCIEVMSLKNEAFDRHFKFLSVYDEYASSNISSQMESICALTGFVSRCEEVLKNLCSQVFSLYAENIINLNGIRLHYIIHHIGELFTLLILIELLISHSSLVTNWNKFCKSLKNFTNNNVYDASEEQSAALHSAINNIQTKIMNDDIVQNSLSNLSKLRTNLVEKNCSAIANELAQYVKLAISNLDKLIQEKPNTHNMYRCIKVNALFVLNTHLLGTNDKKNFRNLIELNIKAHSIYVAGTAIWFSEVFLQRYVPSLCENYGKLSHSMLKARQNYLVTKKASLIRDVVNIQTLCTQWTLHLEDMYNCRRQEISAAEMSLHTKTLLDGLDIASTISHSLLTYVNIHLSLGVPLSKNILMAIFETIDALKSLNNAVSRNQHHINNSINMIIQHLLFQATCFIVEIKKTLMTDKNYANKRLDELTCTVIAERTLKGAATVERNIAANVALGFIPDTTYIEDIYAKMGTILEKILTLSGFLKSMYDYCNCSWMLWHQNILPIYFWQDYSMQLDTYKIKYFLMVLEDSLITLHQTDKYYEQNKSQDFLQTISTIVDDRIIKNFSQNVETNLRLHIHSHLQVDPVNPFSTDMAKKVLLGIDNFRINCIYMAVIPSVEHYLSTMYYNLTTVVLSDWKTYGEMRQMAKWKFDLKTVQDNLPTQTLEQGLDVLEIMRNIHVFVAKYLYNLNNQIFIEKSSNNKHLNSINIRHIANSIRTHGTGIMNTTVNFTYQFLKKKFFTFSQFMYDEHIKSRLIKDLRMFKETTESGGCMYSYKNAERFNKGIKSLGIADDGQSYLDLFRELISQIGNAMGYVRMIRSGGRHCCSDATVFLPSLEMDKSFKDLCVEAELNARCIETSQILDSSLNNVTSNFLQGTEYFKLLVEAFAPVFRNPKNVHLNNFYVIVPPLTLNFVEHIILSKDKMSKKNKVGAAFTDDGFAMGLAYILKLLDQNTQFDSLHWFESVWQHILDERKLLNEQKLKGSVQLQQALALTEKKIKTLEEEYSLLYFTLTSARIFFR